MPLTFVSDLDIGQGEAASQISTS